jgi:cytochrome c553
MSPGTVTWAYRMTWAVLAAAGLFSAAVYLLSERELRRTYAVPWERPLEVLTDSASVARGAHLVRATASCVLCHGEDLGGAVYIDGGPLGIVTGPNLTRGRGGIGASLADADWERAIRHGVRRDGTSLIAMPSEIYAALTDEDLSAIVAYLKQVPPVDREIEPSHFRAAGRVMLAAGKLPILVAPKTPQLEHQAAVTRGPTVEYGRYLAEIGGCHGCHGHGLSGGRVAGPPGLPPASNLTPAGIGAWEQAEFVETMRTGRRPDGRELHEFMPWRVLGRMSDEELHALWLYLQSVPPRPFGRR